MRGNDREIQTLSDYLIDEILLAAGFKKTPRAQRVCAFFFGRLTTYLADICVQTDRRVVTEGFPGALGWMASHWVREVHTTGAENIPAAGPLMVVSNHIGAYDILVAPAQINRRDVKIIASASPFFMRLPNVSQHMCYAADDPQSRMAAARQAMAHLQEGGALLLFGTGLVDPDPQVYPGAAAAIGDWSPSIDLFLHQVPETQVVVSILSGIVLPRWAHSPLTWLRRVDWQKRRIAEYGQVISQLLLRPAPNITPSMSIAPPVSVAALRAESGSERVLPAVIARGRELLQEHCIRNKINILLEPIRN